MHAVPRSPEGFRAASAGRCGHAQARTISEATLDRYISFAEEASHSAVNAEYGTCTCDKIIGVGPLLETAGNRG